MPFTNAYHGAEPQPLDLASRIDAELRARIEDAVDYACLDAMVRTRQGRGEPAPVADNPRDREEYTRRVVEFLARLREAMVPALSDEQRRRVGDIGSPRAGDLAAAVDIQVRLAKELPDYWQRLDQLRQQPSGGGERGLLDRLLGR